jgi:hypothetical protein
VLTSTKFSSMVPDWRSKNPSNDRVQSHRSRNVVMYRPKNVMTHGSVLVQSTFMASVVLLLKIENKEPQLPGVHLRTCPIHIPRVAQQTASSLLPRSYPAPAFVAYTLCPPPLSLRLAFPSLNHAIYANYLRPLWFKYAPRFFEKVS